MTNDIIYLDNNSTTRVDDTVLEEMLPFFSKFYANPSSLSSQSFYVKSIIDTSRKTISEVLNCNPKTLSLLVEVQSLITLQFTPQL